MRNFDGQLLTAKRQANC